MKQLLNKVFNRRRAESRGGKDVPVKDLGAAFHISRHGSFWLWGFGKKDAKVWISLGNEKESVEHVFEEVILVKMITHIYAIGEENGIPLYLCKTPKIDIEEWWQNYEKNVFD